MEATQTLYHRIFKAFIERESLTIFAETAESFDYRTKSYQIWHTNTPSCYCSAHIDAEGLFFMSEPLTCHFRIKNLQELFSFLENYPIFKEN